MEAKLNTCQAHTYPLVHTKVIQMYNILNKEKKKGSHYSFQVWPKSEFKIFFVHFTTATKSTMLAWNERKSKDKK